MNTSPVTVLRGLSMDPSLVPHLPTRLVPVPMAFVEWVHPALIEPLPGYSTPFRRRVGSRRDGGGGATGVAVSKTSGTWQKCPRLSEVIGIYTYIITPRQEQAKAKHLEFFTFEVMRFCSPIPGLYIYI